MASAVSTIAKPTKTRWPYLYKTEQWWWCVWDGRKAGHGIHRHKIGIVGADDELTMARVAQEEVRRIKSGETTQARPAVTVADCWTAYSADLDRRQVATRDSIRKTWDRWAAGRDYVQGHTLPSMRVAELTIPGLQGWFDQLAIDASPAVAEKVRISLTACLRLGQRRIEGFPDLAVIPSSRVEQWRSDPRQTIIPLDRLGAVVAQLRADQQTDRSKDARIRATKAAFVELVLLTGLRMEELRQLRCRDISPETIDGREYLSLHIAHTKNGMPHLVPLVGRAFDLVQAQLRRCPRKGEDWFPLWALTERSVPVHSTTILAYWQTLQQEVGLPAECTIHDCRRTAASLMATAGEDLLDVELMLNHKTLTRVQGTYYRPQLGRLVAIFTQLGDLVEAKVTQYQRTQAAAMVAAENKDAVETAISTASQPASGGGERSATSGTATMQSSLTDCTDCATSPDAHGAGIRKVRFKRNVHNVHNVHSVHNVHIKQKCRKSHHSASSGAAKAQKGQLD